MRLGGTSRHLMLVASGAIILAGCYTLRPVGGVAPEAGQQFAFDINDAGRVALGGSVGPEIAQIEGRLLRQVPGEFVVSVSTVRLLRGGEQVWSGEQLELPTQYVSRVYERRFSRGRTAAFTTAVVGSVALFVVSRDLLGIGGDGREPTDTNVVEVRVPLRLPLPLR